jgi:putative hydrolase of the HAD superfamily
MSIKAVSFDIGGTLVEYGMPRWKPFFEPALSRVMEKCRFVRSEERIRAAATVMAKYNTRENPRDYEVNSETIFREIFDIWHEDYYQIETAKDAFYGFFQTGAACYKDAAETLRFLRDSGIKLGALTDVAYGMDIEYALRDIIPISEYLDLVLTSVDVGFRKPHSAGYIRLLEAFDAAPAEMIYVGDEEKDIIGANRLGIISVLIDRSGTCPDYGQKATIRSLKEICSLIAGSN